MENMRYAVLHSELCGWDHGKLADEVQEFDAMLCWTTDEEVRDGLAGEGMRYSWWCPRCDTRHTVENDDELGRDLARDFRYHSPFDIPEDADLGRCDVCDESYDVGSQIDHCPECGTCWTHCQKPNEHHAAREAV